MGIKQPRTLALVRGIALASATCQLALVYTVSGSRVNTSRIRVYAVVFGRAVVKADQEGGAGECGGGILWRGVAGGPLPKCFAVIVVDAPAIAVGTGRADDGRFDFGPES